MIELSEQEAEVLKNAKKFLNEYAISNANRSRFVTRKKVKGSRKKSKELEKKLNFSKPTPTHAFEALLGSVKMQFIMYMRVDCTESEIKEWVFGIEKELVKRFMNDVRFEICKDIVEVYEKDFCLFKPLAVHNWFYKSGFLKRSNNLFQELYGDIVQYAYAEEIKQLRDKYIDRAGQLMKTGKDLKSVLFDKNINVSSDDYDFFLSINQSKKTMDLILEDMEEDKQFLKKAKYIRSQLGTVCKLMREYLEQNSDEVERMSEMHTEIQHRIERKAEIKRLKEKLGPYYNILDKSCEMEGIILSEANVEVWGSYFESLKLMKRRELAAERKWLGVA